MSQLSDAVAAEKQSLKDLGTAMSQLSQDISQAITDLQSGGDVATAVSGLADSKAVLDEMAKAVQQSSQNLEGAMAPPTPAPPSPAAQKLEEMKKAKAVEGSTQEATTQGKASTEPAVEPMEPPMVPPEASPAGPAPAKPKTEE